MPSASISTSELRFGRRDCTSAYVLREARLSDLRSTLKELVEDNDDEQGGPAVSRVGAKRHTDHDSAMRLCGICHPRSQSHSRVEDDARFQQHDLPALLRSEHGIAVAASRCHSAQHRIHSPHILALLRWRLRG